MLPPASLALLHTIATALAARPADDSEARAFATALQEDLATAVTVGPSSVTDPSDPAVRARRFDRAAAYVMDDLTRVHWADVTPRLRDDGTEDPDAALCADDNAQRDWDPVTPATIRRFVIFANEDRDTMAETVETIAELQTALAGHIARSGDGEGDYWVAAVIDTDAVEQPSIPVRSVRIDGVLLTAAAA